MIQSNWKEAFLVFHCLVFISMRDVNLQFCFCYLAYFHTFISMLCTSHRCINFSCLAFLCLKVNSNHFSALKIGYFYLSKSSMKGIIHTHKENVVTPKCLTPIYVVLFSSADSSQYKTSQYKTSQCKTSQCNNFQRLRFSNLLLTVFKKIFF